MQKATCTAQSTKAISEIPADLLFMAANNIVHHHVALLSGHAMFLLFLLAIVGGQNSFPTLFRDPYEMKFDF